MALPTAAKTALQAKKNAAETIRAAAAAAGNRPAAAAAAREKQDCDRMATFHADTLS